MDITMGMFTYIQIFFAIVIGLYFFNLLKSQQGSKVAVERESKKETEKLRKLREISLTQPLSEKTRPASFGEIIGQEEGLKGLRAALCGPNPQHVIVYGPPGVGKTAAARLVLEEAKRNGISPFRPDAKFVEIDGATARFDERGIADPLIGSVHDPIYQGAGPLGIAGIPQPKLGAVTKAHGGMLFIDEIGELHPIQMNKLLKVLEDRKVFLESAYYNSEDTAVPSHIRDIFENGLPADFRLVGATTRSPEDIPPAIRSRCVEVFFRALLPDEVALIAKNAAGKIGYEIEDQAIETIKAYASNGREAVNFIQLASGIALYSGRKKILGEDIEWVVASGQHSPRFHKKVGPTPQVGVVNGLAVYGPNMATLIEIEVCTIPVGKDEGKITVTGIIEEEEIESRSKTVKRKSMALSSVQNVLTVLRYHMSVSPLNFDIHVNLSGGVPVDGPSAGISLATAIYSSIMNLPVSNEIAMTGEVSIRGFVKPVGGIVPKIECAKQAGVKKVIIPKENWQEMFRNEREVEIIPVTTVSEVIHYVFSQKIRPGLNVTAQPPEVLAASPI